MKSAMITISGRPNVGKSTLLNALVGEKISIVTNKPQTTRNRITAVLNTGETEFIFVDTPGYHLPQTKLGDYMVKVVRESVTDMDSVILMVEPIANIGTQEEKLISMLKENRVPSVLVINKIDKIEKQELFEIIDLYSKAFDFDEIIPISAKTGDGLENLKDVLGKYAKEGPQLFPDGMVSDQPDKQIVAEIIREKLLLCLQREIPHGTAVEVNRFTERESGIIDLDVTIFCEKASHKGIIIGKNGVMLKKIGEMARNDIENFMGTKVFLQTWIKVKERWRDSDYLLRNFGYNE